MNNSAQIEPEGLSVLEASTLAGIGRSKVYQAIRDGSLRAAKCGKRTIVLRREVLRYLEALPAANTPNQKT